MSKKYNLIFFILLCTFSFSNRVHAQQTIFNVPSADVLRKEQLFFQHESQFSKDFGLFTNYGAYGVGKNTEIDLTLFGVGTKKVKNEVIGVGFKTALPIHEKSETKLTLGSLIPISLNGNGVGGYSYSHISTRIPSIKTRITSGLLVGTTILFGKDIVCYIAGIEQPITKNLNLLLDWHSGNHPNGLLIAGFSFGLPSSTVFIFGYQVPNKKTFAKNGFIIELAKYFR